MSRWRACASQALTPLLVTVTQNWPSLTAAFPSPGVVNDVVHGMYLPPSKVLFLSRSCPDSAGTCRPGEPLVGAAFQSIIDGGGGAAGAATGGGWAAVAGGGVACEVGAPHAPADSASRDRKAVARRRGQATGSSIGESSGGEPACRRPRDPTPKGIFSEAAPDARTIGRGCGHPLTWPAVRCRTRARR